MAQVLHLTGPVLVGREEVRPQAWVVGGRITYEPPSGDHEVTRVDGWVLPGLVDAHCHVGLDAHGAVDRETARGAGARRPRGRHPAHPRRRLAARTPAGSTTAPTCRASSAPAGTSRGPAATSATTRGRSSPRTSSSGCASRPGRATGGSSSSATGSTATPATSRRAGPPTSSPRPSPPPTRRARGSPPTASASSRSSTSPPPAPTASSTPSAWCPTRSRRSPRQGIAIVPTLVNIDTFPEIAEPAKEKFPGYHAHMLDLHARRYETDRRRARRGHRRLRRHRRRRLAAARARRPGGRAA